MQPQNLLDGTPIVNKPEQVPVSDNPPKTSFNNFSSYQPPPAQNPQTNSSQFNLMSAPAAQMQPPPGQSVEQQAMNGGGVNNKQQVNNFMTALNNVGAGSNNNFMHANNPTQEMPGNLVNPNVLPTNGSTGAGYNPATAGKPFNPQAMAQAQNPTPSPTFNPFQSASALNLNQNQPIFQPGQLQQAALQTPVPNPGQQMAQSINPIDPNTQMVQANPQSNPAPNFSPTQQFFQAQGVQQPNINKNLLSSQVLVSDENLKTNINPANKDIQSFMNSINAHNYEYKDKNDGHGQHTSPMAQEIEQTEIGKQAIINTPRGKMVDYGRLGGITLASVAVLNQEKADKSIMERENMKLQKQINQLRKAFRK